MGKYTLLNHTLDAIPGSDKIVRVLESALIAADPFQAVRVALDLQDGVLHIGDYRYDLALFSRIFVVAFGKASLAMTLGLAATLGERLSGGIVVLKHAPADGASSGLPAAIKVLVGGHPVPDSGSLESARQVFEFARQLKADDLVFCLISGGGSALLSLPAGEIALLDIQGLTGLLLASGANIGEMNTLRKHIDQIKGGGLARAIHPANLVTLVLSDVIGSPLDVIASGPTTADPSTFLDAMNVIQKYHLEEKTPLAIRRWLEAGLQGNIPETVKPGDPVLAAADIKVISSNFQAAQAAVLTARQEGFDSQLLTTFLNGEARQAGNFMAGILRQMASSDQPVRRPGCLVLGGETTVTLRGSGLGGRNLETALGAVYGAAGLEKAFLITLATDGEDGPTDAAGAVITGETLKRGIAQGLAPGDFLDRNDSYSYFEQLGDLIQTGPTGTNVNDLAFLFTLV
ncbi:MAG: glycerate kinase [Anaerolineaceae bacterium]|nr:glycerate kinase [Anaerolineaceae bacterium]